MDAGSVARRLVEKFNGVGKSEVRIVGAQLGRGNALFVPADDDGGGARFFGVGAVPAIGEERQLAGLRVFDSRYARDFDSRVAIEIALQARGNVAQLHG